MLSDKCFDGLFNPLLWIIEIYMYNISQVKLKWISGYFLILKSQNLNRLTKAMSS